MKIFQFHFICNLLIPFIQDSHEPLELDNNSLPCKQFSLLRGYLVFNQYGTFPRDARLDAATTFNRITRTMRDDYCSIYPTELPKSYNKQ